jgi:hypothetical protein
MRDGLKLSTEPDDEMWEPGICLSRPAFEVMPMRALPITFA